jgi:hypothetical protein
MPARLVMSGGPAWALIGFTAAMAAGLIFTSVQLLNAREALGECRGDKTSHIETATTNAEAVDAMRGRLAQCLDEQGADLRAQAEATENYSRRLRELTELVTRERAERDRIYEGDECAAWAAELVCSDLDQRLRNPGPQD